MPDANLYIPHNDTEAYAAYWTERHVAEFQPNPHVVFYNPLRRKEPIDHREFQLALWVLVGIFAACNVLIGLVVS